MKTTQDSIARIRAEFLEMPGMRLTMQQVQRLCGIERTLCQTVLDALVEEKFLSVKPDGAYGRRMEEDFSRSRQLKATFRSGIVSPPRHDPVTAPRERSAEARSVEETMERQAEEKSYRCPFCAFTAGLCLTPRERSRQMTTVRCFACGRLSSSPSPLTGTAALTVAIRGRQIAETRNPRRGSAA